MEFQKDSIDVCSLAFDHEISNRDHMIFALVLWMKKDENDYDDDKKTVMIITTR